MFGQIISIFLSVLFVSVLSGFCYSYKDICGKYAGKEKKNKEAKTLKEKPIIYRSHWQFICKVDI